MIIVRAIDNFNNTANLDILEQADLLIDVSKVESGDIGQVFGLSSQEFMMPGTDNNNQFFGNMFDIGVEGTVALNHSIYATVLVDGQEIFSGRLIVNEILKDDKGYVMYKTNIVDEFVDFKLRIEDLRMRDLDMSAFDHTNNYGNITGSWDLNTAGGAVVYPLVDYGYEGESEVDADVKYGPAFTNNNAPLPQSYWKPALRLKEVINAVFDTVNYSYSSSFIDGDYFEKLYMLTTPDEQQGIPTNNPQEYTFEANMSGSTQVVADGADDVVIFTNEVYDNGGNYNPTTGEFRVPAAGNYYFSANARVEYGSSPTGNNLRQITTRIEKNGITVATNVTYTNTTTGFLNIGQILNNLSQSDLIRITVENRTVTGFNGNIVGGADFTIQGQVNFFHGQSFGALFASQVDASLMFSPDLKVQDFLRSIIQKFNLVVEPKKNNRNILIMEPYDVWVEAGETKDWSAKVDNSVRKSIKGTMKDQKEFISFKDAEDEDVLNQIHIGEEGQVFGEALYVGQPDLIRGTLEIHDDFFAPTPLFPIGLAGGDEVPHLYTHPNNAIGAVDDPFEFKPRLFHYNGLKDFRYVEAYSSSLSQTVGATFSHNGYWLEDDAGNPQAITQYPQFAHYETDDDSTIQYPSEGVNFNYSSSRDLNFNNSNQRYFNNIFQTNYGYPQTVNYVIRDAVYEYWRRYLNFLYNPDTKTLTLNIKFDPTDLVDIQLNDKIFIEGHYYRINSIKAFDLIDPASVEVELITAPIRQFDFPVRRIWDIDGPNSEPTGQVGYTDVTLDAGTLSPDGSGTYVYVDDFTAVTGSGNQELVGRAAAIDRFNYFPNDDGNVNVQTKTVPQGRNYGANLLLGPGNEVANNIKNAIVQGGGNTIESTNTNVSIFGNNNTIKSNNIDNVTVHGSQNTISGSSDNLFIVNSDNNTFTNVTSSVVLSPTEDVEDYESGRVIVGDLRRQGQQFESYKVLEGGPGEVYDLADGVSGYFHYHLSYTSSVNGTTDVFLPDAAVSSSKDIQYRFTTDGTLNASKTMRIRPSGSDTIDGGAEKSLTTTYDGLTTQNIEGEWIVIQEKK